MKKLHNKVNIVPVIAKSDVLTKKEIQRLKKKVIFVNSTFKFLKKIKCFIVFFEVKFLQQLHCN